MRYCHYLPYRKQGLARLLIEEIMSHPELKGLRTWSLRTAEEARKIYEEKGFRVAENSDTNLEVNDLDIYVKSKFVNLHKNY